MAVNTLLLDFSVDPATVQTEGQMSVITANIENVLKDYLTNFKVKSVLPLDNGGLLKLYVADRDTVATIRVFINGLVTVNIEYFKADSENEKIFTIEVRRSLLSCNFHGVCNEFMLVVPCSDVLYWNVNSKLSWTRFAPKCFLLLNGVLPLMSTCLVQRVKNLERDVRVHGLGKKSRSQSLPIKRGTFMGFYMTSDERLLEYDIDELVFEQRSRYQKIQIVHSRTLGNMLILDDLQNISEADLIYTETLMGRGRYDYRDKEIVILGGGDGALLYELLKEKPKHVIMLEIDDVVMKACAKHMRSICGDVLDSMSGPHYEIIVDDCMKSLQQFIAEGRKFDYVFGDLTDVPISDAPSSGEQWQFIDSVLTQSLQILKPNGKFMTHIIGTAAKEALDLYEARLKKIRPAINYSKSAAFVPSFLEEWVFCQIWRSEQALDENHRDGTPLTVTK